MLITPPVKKEKRKSQRVENDKGHVTYYGRWTAKEPEPEREKELESVGLLELAGLKSKTEGGD